MYSIDDYSQFSVFQYRHLVKKAFPNDLWQLSETRAKAYYREIFDAEPIAEADLSEHPEEYRCFMIALEELLESRGELEEEQDEEVEISYLTKHEARQKYHVGHKFFELFYPVSEFVEESPMAKKYQNQTPKYSEAKIQKILHSQEYKTWLEEKASYPKINYLGSEYGKQL